MISHIIRKNTRRIFITIDIIDTIDPVKCLLPNKHHAMKVYNQQVKKLNNNMKDKTDVLMSEKKLQDAGFVDYVRNLSEEQQLMLTDSKVQNFIPWRSVWKESSI